MRKVRCPNWHEGDDVFPDGLCKAEDGSLQSCDGPDCDLWCIYPDCLACEKDCDTGDDYCEYDDGSSELTEPEPPEQR